MTAPDVLAFADRKIDGAYDVTEPSGVVVARIQVKTWGGSAFRAVTAAGEPLCAGRRAGFLSSTWQSTDPRGQVVASVRNLFWGGPKPVALGDGRRLTLKGRILSRDWALRDDQGLDVLSSTPSNSAWSFHPDAWLVRSHDASLDLAHVVAIVQLNRMMVKAARSSAAAAS